MIPYKYFRGYTFVRYTEMEKYVRINNTRLRYLYYDKVGVFYSYCDSLWDLYERGCDFDNLVKIIKTEDEK